MSWTDIQKCLVIVNPSNWRRWFINPLIGRSKPDANKAVEMKARLLKGFCIIVWLITDYLDFYILAEKAHSCFFYIAHGRRSWKIGTNYGKCGNKLLLKVSQNKCIYRFPMFQRTGILIPDRIVNQSIRNQRRDCTACVRK